LRSLKADGGSRLRARLPCRLSRIALDGPGSPRGQGCGRLVPLRRPRDWDRRVGAAGANPPRAGLDEADSRSVCAAAGSGLHAVEAALAAAFQPGPSPRGYRPFTGASGWEHGRSAPVPADLRNLDAARRQSLRSGLRLGLASEFLASASISRGPMRDPVGSARARRLWSNSGGRQGIGACARTTSSSPARSAARSGRPWRVSRQLADLSA